MSYLKQNIIQAIYYALKDPSDRINIILAIVFIVCPALLFIAAFAKRVPRTWIYFVGFTAFLVLIVPVGHYMIPMIPFLAMMAAKSIEKKSMPDWAYLVGALLLIPTLRFTAGALVSPWGPLGRRQYGLMDMYYEAEVVKHQNLKPPVWTSWGPIIWIDNLPTVGNNFIDLMQDGENIDWTQKPYSDVNTKIYFYSKPGKIPPQSIIGWSFEDVPLSRGQHYWMRIWRRGDR